MTSSLFCSAERRREELHLGSSTHRRFLRQSSKVMAAVRRAFVLLFVVLAVRSAEGHRPIYNVLNFHATGDGKTDDAQAFLATWQAACSDGNKPVMAIPGGRAFLLSSVSFEGPCKSPITIKLDGKIVAPNYIWTKESDNNLLTFQSVDDLMLDGNGEIDGQGAIWWDCYNQKRCSDRPILLAFVWCNNLRVRRIHLKNSADKHMTLYQCNHANMYNVSITAPADSPNTDGITVSSSNNTYISNCNIQSGDDCVSFLSHTKNVTVTHSRCGPGHGISVGSLGKSETAMVEQIKVSKCSFFGTMTGVRIKSWQGGEGYAKGFLFENLNMTDVQYPIVIDQFYCPQGNCPEKPGGVAISDAKFINIQGTSSEEDAIRILCSRSVHCQGIYLSNVNISWANHTSPPNATIWNAHGATAGMVVPRIHFSNPL